MVRWLSLFSSRFQRRLCVNFFPWQLVRGFRYWRSLQKRHTVAIGLPMKFFMFPISFRIPRITLNPDLPTRSNVSDGIKRKSEIRIIAK